MVRGHEEVLALWEQFRSVWTRLVFQPEEIIEDDGELVIARIHVEATAAESGIGVDRTIHYLMQVRDDLLARIVPFDSLAEARAAAGEARG